MVEVVGKAASSFHRVDYWRVVFLISSTLGKEAIEPEFRSILYAADEML